jgi:ubiquinone/menaquinone biosynthesis C-methylase UbiE
MRRTLQTPPDAGRVRHAWDRAAEAYAAGQASGRDFYRYEFFGPAQVEMCGDVRSREILDVGCGTGYFARQMAERGASVTGVDLSPRMIEQAKRIERDAPHGIVYRVMDAANLDALPDGSFDVATSCVVLQDVPDAFRALREVRRVLRAGGRFVVSISHPGTDTPHRVWAKDADGRKAWLEVDRYFDRASFEADWDWGPGFSTASRHAPLEDWFGWIREARFVVTAFREPHPTPEALARRPELEDASRVPYFAMFDLRVEPGRNANTPDLKVGPTVMFDRGTRRPDLQVGRAPITYPFSDDTSTRSWDAIADDWVAHADTNDYRNDFLLPRTLAMLGDVRGRTILDLGCGEGGYSRELARRGARVVAVDGSQTLVAVAGERASLAGLDITCARANANALVTIEDASIDLVLASMSLMDVEDYAGAVREIRRVLEPAGELVMSLTHPCFSTRAARWTRDAAGRPAAFVMDRYFVREVWEDFITPRFRRSVLRRHRPLEDYLGEPLRAGFVLRDLCEPSAGAADLEKSARFAYLTRVPYFMVLRFTRA